MIRDITLGQYYDARSPIHRLDPRSKILGTIVYIVALFLVESWLGFAVAILGLALVTALSKVPLSFILRGMKPILFILIFTFCLNIFMADGRILWQWKFLKVTDEGVHIAIFMAVRLILLIIGSSLLTLTTKPISMTDGLEKLLRPMSYVGMPAEYIAMTMSIALRFIPLLLEETDKIMKAQQARGADFETGNIFRRAKALVPILVPLFINTFRIAEDLAMAMEARCYHGGPGRTRMNAIAFSWIDCVFGFCLVCFLAVIITFKIMGI